MEESRKLFEVIVGRSQTCAQCFYGLARVAMAGGERAAAIGHYRRALELFPDYGAALYGLGMALRSEGRLGEAQQLLELAQRKKQVLMKVMLSLKLMTRK